MRAATILACLSFLIASLSAQARDYNDLPAWSLEDLCEKKEKQRYAAAIFAEIERRESFSSQDLELIRSGIVDLGMDQVAVQCSWGEPDAVLQSDSETLQVYHRRIDGQRRTVFVHVIAGQVTDIHVGPPPPDVGSDPPSVDSLLHSDRLLSGLDPSMPAGTSPCVVGCLRQPVYTTVVPE
jgi:hypothetical protein